MLKYLCSAVLAASLLLAHPFISNAPTSSRTTASAQTTQPSPSKKPTGLTLPADIKVNYDEGFVRVDAETVGQVKWLVLSKQKVKYVEAGEKSIIVSVPPVATTITVFAVAVIDGKLTDFVSTNIIVNGKNETSSSNEDTQPLAPKIATLNVIFVIDADNIALEQARLLNSQSLRDALERRGHILRIIPATSKLIDEKKLRTYLAEVGGTPALVVMDSEGNVKETLRMPVSEAAVLELVDKHGKVK